MTEGDEAHRAAERAARESYGRLVAYLAARTRDLTAAEDALAEAFASALEHWPVRGVPDSPDAWLLTAARRKQTDDLRKTRTRNTNEGHLRMLAEEFGSSGEPGAIPDKRLALMFACAHPAIEPAMRTPLILQTVLGLNAAEIASAFLLPPATMSQRLVRAKTRIRDTGIGFAIPELTELDERLAAVLDAIYAIYSRGWAELGEPGTPALADEAIWLGQLIVRLMPEQPEAKGMLALMLYAEARRPARIGGDSDYVPLEEQDTDLWDRPMLQTAEFLLQEANRAGPSGGYQLEAAIQSAHAARLLSGRNTWPAIVGLYDHLFRLTGSPVVALNRAVALSHIKGPEIAIRLIEELGTDKRMTGFQPYWAALGHLHAEAGSRAKAREALTVAIGLSNEAPERRYLQDKRDSLQDG